METPSKNEIRMILTVTALVLFAWLSRFMNIPGTSGSNIYRSVIYPSVFLFWSLTLHHRLIHPQVRHLAESIGLLMVFWFAVRTIKYSVPPQHVTVIRYLWYMFYLPMLFIPVVAVLTAQTIGLPETERLAAPWKLLWLIGGALFLLVFTNDFHQLVFDFAEDGSAWTDSNFHYAAGYYFYAVFVVGCNLATLITLILKCRHPKTRLWTLLPCIPVFLSLLYWALYIMNVHWLHVLFGDLTAFSCVMYMAAFELCIRCGLIRSNSGYRELLEAGSLGVQITDSKHHVCLAGRGMQELTKEQILHAEVHPELLQKNVVLKSQPIRYGHVLWQEDVAELTEAIEQFEENCKDLQEQNTIEREKMKADQELMSLQEKNREEDLLRQETAVQLELIDRLLTQYEAETEETLKRRLLAGAAVAGSYIKRCGNLLLVSQQNPEADLADLTRCFEESFQSLKLLGAECICSLTPGTKYRTEDLLQIYKSFEEITEYCMFTVQQIWIHGRESRESYQLIMEFVTDADLSSHADKAVSYTEDSGTSRFLFRLKKDGGSE